MKRYQCDSSWLPGTLFGMFQVHTRHCHVVQPTIDFDGGTWWTLGHVAQLPCDGWLRWRVAEHALSPQSECLKEEKSTSKRCWNIYESSLLQPLPPPPLYPLRCCWLGHRTWPAKVWGQVRFRRHQCVDADKGTTQYLLVTWMFFQSRDDSLVVRGIWRGVHRLWPSCSGHRHVSVQLGAPRRRLSLQRQCARWHRPLVFVINVVVLVVVIIINIIIIIISSSIIAIVVSMRFIFSKTRTKLTKYIIRVMI